MAVEVRFVWVKCRERSISWQLDEAGHLNVQDLAAVFDLQPASIRLNYQRVQWNTAGNIMPALDEGVSEDAPIIVTGITESRFSCMPHNSHVMLLRV